MDSITFQNEFGQTIELKRSEEEGFFAIRHTRFHPVNFGTYYESSERVKYPPVARFLLKFEVDLSDVQPGEGGAYAVIERRVCILNAAEIAMIRDAIKKFG